MTQAPPFSRFSPLAFARAHPVRTILAATIVLSLVLIAFPGLDLAATRLFYAPGEGFAASKLAFFLRLRELGIESFRLLVIVAAVSLAAPFVFSGTRFLLPPRAGLFLLTAAAFGPGLLVNVLFKGFWGRARPYQVTDFGGTLPYSPPWVIAGNCDWNCSFVAGEASSSMMMMGLALIAPPGWRRPVSLGALAFTSVISLNRMAFGGHFLSDVIVAWMVTLLVLVVSHRAIYGRSSGLTDEGIALALGSVGDQVKQAVRRAASAVAEFFRAFR